YVIALNPNAASTKLDSVSRSREGNGDWVSVYFMDERRRCYLQYGFQEKQPGKLFLASALFREFAANTYEVIDAKSFAFREDGRTVIEERNLVNDIVEEREATFSVEENWDAYPSFGDYASLCREQRARATGN